MIPFDLQHTLDAVTAAASSAGVAQGIAVSYRFEAEIRDGLVGEEQRLRRSLQLLLNHAIEVTPDGSVEVLVRPLTSAVGRQRVRFEVRHGQRLQQMSLGGACADSAAGETSDLFLWFQLTRRMTADLGIHCSREGGNRCWFTLDFARDEQECTLSDGQPAAPRRVLVVDDNLVNQKVAWHMIRKLGYEVDLCANGEQAVAAVQGGDYGLVLMDCQMPVMDGYQATEVIRRREGYDEHVPIVALTAHAVGENERHCREIGMDGFLTKPVSGASLSRVLKDWIPAC